MSHYPSSLLKLIKHLSRLPGIGEKTAERLSMHIIRSSRKEAEALAASILEIKGKIEKNFALQVRLRALLTLP